MITLSNGYKFDVACASGAFAFLNGWYWEKPLCWLGWLRPQEWTITIKTLTLERVKGNLRIWYPFNLYRNCVQNFKVDDVRGTVNAVGLSNLGLPAWIDKYYPKVKKLGLNVILSVMANNKEEAKKIAQLLRPLTHVRAVEINPFCPNVEHDESIANVVDVVKEINLGCRHPLGIKLSGDVPYLEIAEATQNYVEWVTLINTMKWSTVYPNLTSPLDPLVGGVSGDALIPYSREALTRYVGKKLKVPAVSCGGINSANEAYARFVMGAKAIQIGTKIKDDPIGAQQMFDEIVKNIRG